MLKRPALSRLTLFLPDGTEAVVQVVEVGRGAVRLGVVAPPAVEVWREELITPALLADIARRRAERGGAGGD